MRIIHQVYDIRPFNFKQGEIPIYAHDRVINNLKERFNYIFTTVNRYPGAPSVKLLPLLMTNRFK
jgi:phosphoribosyl 1,2-cyclic phosphate phosphodiesterase